VLGGGCKTIFHIQPNRVQRTLPGWNSIMGPQFQNLVLHNRHLIQKKLHIKSEDIAHKGCQIDYMIQTKLNSLFVREIKFSKNEVGFDIIQAMDEKLSRLTHPKGFSYWPVLIHVNGVSEKVEDSGYFTSIINFSDFLKTDDSGE
jgi:hypothetical protein